MTSWAERQRDADANWRNERLTAETVACPWCHQPRGQTCLNSLTGEPMERVPAHWQRLFAVEHGQEVDS